MNQIKFIAGLMGSGKTAELIEEHNRLNGQTVVARVIAHRNGDTRVHSRNGKFLDNIKPIYLQDDRRNQYEDIKSLFESEPQNYPILIDEVQFLEPSLIYLIFRLSIDSGRSVKMYGLHSDFKGRPFPATKVILKFIPRDQWTFIDMKCQENSCDCIAGYNARFLENGKIDVGGPLILQEKSSYRSICRGHFVDHIKSK